MWCLSDRLLWRIALVIGLCAALGVETRCRSIPINQKIEEQKTKNEKAKQIAKKYIPVGELLDAVTGALDGSSSLLHDTNKEREKEKAGKEEARQEAKEARAEASTWRWIKRGFYVLGAAAIAWLIWSGLKKFGSKIPVIGQFF